MDKNKFIKTFLIFLAVFAIIAIFVGFRLNNMGRLRDESNIFDQDEKEEIEVTEENPFEDDIFTFLLAGIDHNNLSDTLIICKLDFKTGEIDMISIPRDAKIPVNGKDDKITHAHGRKNGGIKLTIDSINDFFGINLEYYARVDFEGVEKIIDVLGGVEIDIKQDMKYTDTTEGEELFIDFKKGRQTLDGEDSLKFLRFRRYPQGDVGRVHAQQQFMTAFIKKALRPSNVTKIFDFLDIYYEYVDTNVPLPQINQLLSIVTKLDPNNINSYVMPGEGTEPGVSPSYYIVDEDESYKLLEEILGEDEDINLEKRQVDKKED